MELLIFLETLWGCSVSSINIAQYSNFCKAIGAHKMRFQCKNVCRTASKWMSFVLCWNVYESFYKEHFDCNSNISPVYVMCVRVCKIWSFREAIREVTFGEFINYHPGKKNITHTHAHKNGNEAVLYNVQHIHSLCSDAIHFCKYLFGVKSFIGWQTLTETHIYVTMIWLHGVQWMDRWWHNQNELQLVTLTAAAAAKLYYSILRRNSLTLIKSFTMFTQSLLPYTWWT